MKKSFVGRLEPISTFTAVTEKKIKKRKKTKSITIRVKNALMGKGGSRGSRRVNEDGLNAEQEMFCELYATDREFFGDGVNSYIEAYDIEVGHGEGKATYESCRSSSSTLLTKPNILKRIDELLSEDGFNDQYVDKTLKFLITQKANLTVTLGAISAYNALKGRVKQKIDHTHKLIGVVKHFYEQADEHEKITDK